MRIKPQRGKMGKKTYGEEGKKKKNNLERWDLEKEPLNFFRDGWEDNLFLIIS